MKVQLFEVLKKAQAVRMLDKLGVVKPSAKYDGKFHLIRVGTAKEYWFADQECEMHGNKVSAIHWSPREPDLKEKLTFEVLLLTPLDEEDFV